MLASKPRTAVLTPFAAPSNTTQAKTALFRGFLDFLSNTVAYNGGVWVRRIQSLIYIICSFGEWCCTTNKSGRFIMGFGLAWAAEALRWRLMPYISAIALPS